MVVDRSDKLENVRADVYVMVKGITEECRCHSFSQGMEMCVIPWAELRLVMLIIVQRATWLAIGILIS